MHIRMKRRRKERRTGGDKGDRGKGKKRTWKGKVRNKWWDRIRGRWMGRWGEGRGESEGRVVKVGREGDDHERAGASGRASEREEKKNPEETSEHNTSDDDPYSVPHLAFPLLLCPGFLRSCGGEDKDQSSRCPQNSPPEINFTLLRRAHAVEIAYSPAASLSCVLSSAVPARPTISPPREHVPPQQGPWDTQKDHCRLNTNP